MPKVLTRLGGTRLKPVLDELARPGARSESLEISVPSEGRVFTVTCSPVRGVDGEAHGMVVVLSDVSKARALQRQIAQSEKLSALGELISGVAHELNNPLASVIGLAQLLRDRGLDPDTRRKLDAIDQEASRCRSIVRSMLSLTGPPQPERNPLDLNAAIDSVIQILGRQIQMDDISVHLDLQPDLSPVMGDFHLMRQVFLNIVYNAYQAMKEKGGAGALTLQTRNEAGRVVIRISDNGPGIAPNHLKRIYDPFFTTKEVGKGTGLGLSLAYTAVQQHGGTIDAASELGRGTTFTVSLPAAPPGSLPAPAEIPTAAASASSHASTRPCSGRRILVVEDERSLAEVMEEALQAQGHDVETAGDGRTAKALVAQGRFDLIITDLKMPNMNGRDFYRHIAAVDPSLARRIIFSTGDTANPETRAFFEEVGNPILSKPFNLRDLIHVVETALGED